MKKLDLEKTIEQLENKAWGPPEYDSYLVTTIHKLRKKPLKSFSDEDLRICIGQEMAVEYLVPISLERLSKTPFIEGDFFRGDLLNNVAHVNGKFWKQHPKLKKQLREVLEKATSQLHKLSSLEQAKARETIELGFSRIAAG